MKRHTRRFVTLTCILFLSSCATGGASSGGGRAARVNRDVITQEDVFRYVNAYDAINAMNPTWLRARGTDSLNNPSQVWVYINGSRLGGVESLRTVTGGDVAEIRFYDGLAATQRWGMGHGAGVIAITTRMR
jgi:hypothetical protein